MSRAASTSLRGPRLLALVLAAGLVYALAYCLWYSATPMGAHPVLDGKENLQLAWDISEGRLAAEPFYRAPLYPLILSLAYGLGLPESLGPDFARLVNLAAWLASVWLVARLALQLWNHERAAVAAAAIWAFYPVGVFFTGDPLDITLAIALMLGGLDRACAFLRTASPQAAMSSGFLLALAALTRPQMWAIALAMPVVLIVLVYGLRRGPGVEVIQPNEKPPKAPPRWPVFFIFLGLSLPAVMMGAFNKKLSGEFVIMPTQGPFNLWAANRPGSHGKYFAQQVEVYQDDRHENPARVESIYHYRKDRGVDASLDWGDINAYWRERTKQMVAEDPGGFAGRLSRKVYYLFNDYEQYNNKTFSVHKALAPALRFNPLGWGVLLIAGAPLLFWGRKNPLVLAILLGAAAAFVGGLALTYVSARFRLPLAPLLAVISSGWLVAPWRDVRGWRLIAGCVAVLVAAGLTFTSLLGVRKPSTEIQDYLLLGYAAMEAGQDGEAMTWADRALAEDSTRLAARELKVVAQYNLELTDILAGAERPSGPILEARLHAAESIAAYSPRVAFIAGVYAWWHGDADEARAQWLSLVEQTNSVSQSALTALLMTGELPQDALPALARIPEKLRQPMLQVALAHAAGQPLNEQGQGIVDQLQAVYGTP